jgi:hypothetical protein
VLSTVEYYLSDTNDRNRFKTAWLYVNEFVVDHQKKIDMFTLIVNHFCQDKRITSTNKDNLVQLISNSKIMDAMGKRKMLQRVKDTDECQADEMVD